MRLLLDTHVMVWALIEPFRLSLQARALIADGRNQVFASAVSLFEIAAKRTPMRRTSPPLSAADAASLVSEAGYSILDITPTHAVAVEGLAPFHSDPFDRLILAQAISEKLRLLTHDEDLASFTKLSVLT